MFYCEEELMQPVKPRNLWAWLLVVGVILYVVVLLFAPLVAVVQSAFGSGIERALSSLNDPELLHAAGVTVALALLTVAINTVLGIIIAWVLVRHRFPGKFLVNAFVDMPVVTSPVIIGFVIIVLFGRGGWVEAIPLRIAFAFPGMLLVTLFVTLPFVVREIMPILASMTREQEDAAATLGATPWRIFRRVIFPVIWQGVLYGAILTLARTVGDFGGVLAVGGGIQGSTETATIYVYRALNDRNPIGAYSVAVLLGAFAILVLLVMNRLRHEPTGEVSVVDETL